jgi:ribosome modulation factor
MTAFEQGYDAFLRGLNREENPFDAAKCSFSVKRWIDGWNKAYRARQEKQT